MAKKKRIGANAVRVGDTIYIGGQTGLGPDGKPVSPDFIPQAEEAYRKLLKVLADAGAKPEDVVHLTAYVTSYEDHDTNMEVRKRFFPEPPPGRSTVVVKSMGRPGSLIEMHAIAVVDR